MNFKLIFVILIAAVAAAAQSPAKVLSRANKALGGEKLLKSVRSWEATGTITRQSDGARGRYEAEASGGTLYGEMFDLNGFEYAVGYNGKSGWMRDSRNGLRTLTGDLAKDFQAEAAFRNTRWLNAKAEKTKIINGGVSNLNGRDANVVVLSTSKGVLMKLFFDSATGLPIREEIPHGTGFKTFDYADFRAAGGIRAPFSITARVGDETFEITLDEVRQNVPVERAKFDFPRLSGEALPDISALLAEVRANTERVDELLENYSYTELRITRDPLPNGQLVETGSEKRLLTFYKGFRINRLIEKNGRPLSESDQAKEDRDAQKQVTEIEERIAEREKKLARQREAASGTGGTPNGDGQRITIGDALKGSLLTNPRRERYKSNEVIVFDYEPNPAFKPQTRMEKLFALCTGAVWVDLRTKQVVRLDAVLTKSAGNFIAKAKRGASFTLENELVNNEIWLPSQADINLSIKILFAGININNLIRYGDYSKFRTEVTDATVDEVKKP
jgi:hypothetical protein